MRELVCPKNAASRTKHGYRSDLDYAVSGNMRPGNDPPATMNLFETLRSSMAPARPRHH